MTPQDKLNLAREAISSFAQCDPYGDMNEMKLRIHKALCELADLCENFVVREKMAHPYHVSLSLARLVNIDPETKEQRLP